jgi:hypothetical protein
LTAGEHGSEDATQVAPCHACIGAAMPASPPAIYLSYRRADTRQAAGRLHDDLQRLLPASRLLIDMQFEPGVDFRQAVQSTLAQASVVLVLIGSRWLSDAGPGGRPRITDANDWVRLEIAAALQRDLPVVPLLVDGAQLPKADALPDDLRPLLVRNAFELSADRWQADVERLCELLARQLPAPGPVDRLRALLRPSAAPAPAAAPAAAPAPAPPRKTTAVAASAAPAVPPADADARHVFISYAFEDEAWAQRVVAAVEAMGYRCWVASRDIAPGTASYPRAITQAIRASRLFVVLLSEACNASDDVLNEITLAKDAKVPRLPVRIDEAPIGDGLLYFFSQAQRLEGGGQGVDAVLDRLTAAVRQHLAAQPAAG